MSKVCIVIPTYNEKGNIQKLLEEVIRVTQPLVGWKVKMLVVDDKSPDGTAEIVEKLQKQHSNIHLITGDRNGLGAAYIRGFSYAIETFSPDYIMEMDADFQHKPEDIPRFLREAENGEQFIIGSRYVAGGDIPSWSFKRKAYSWGANVLARNIAGIGDINDCTSGFRCIDATLFKIFDLKDIRANGYAFQLNLLHVAVKKKFKIKEIPILFPERTAGESKLGEKDIREFFFLAFALRIKRYHWREIPEVDKEGIKENMLQSDGQSSNI